MSSRESLPRLDRRTALKWMLTATASIAVTDRVAAAVKHQAAESAGMGYGTEPAMNQE